MQNRLLSIILLFFVIISAHAQLRLGPEAIKLDRTIRLIEDLYVDDVNTEEITERFIKLIIVEDEDTPEIEYQKGDVNLDGKINIKDATLVQKYLVKIVDLTDKQRSLADFDGDLTVSISDTTAIQKWIASIKR